jgi:hypothetical protein
MARKPLPEQLAQLQAFKTAWPAAGELPEPDFPSFDLCGIELEEAQLYGLAFDGSLFRAAQLYGAHFDNASLCRVDFADADLSKAEFNGAALRSANFSGARLFRTNFFGADLSYANFTGAELFKVGLADANLEGILCDVSLDACYLQGARLSGARLSRIKNVEAAHFDWIEVDGKRLSGAAAREWLRGKRASAVPWGTAQRSNHQPYHPRRRPQKETCVVDWIKKAFRWPKRRTQGTETRAKNESETAVSASNIEVPGEKLYRQGDLLVRLVGAAEAEVEALTVVTLAEGEATGHAHRVYGAAMSSRRDDTGTAELRIDVPTAGPCCAMCAATDRKPASIIRSSCLGDDTW